MLYVSGKQPPKMIVRKSQLSVTKVYFLNSADRYKQLTQLNKDSYMYTCFRWINKEHTAKFKWNTVDQGIYKTQNVLQNPEWISFNANSFDYLPDFS